ncbi:retropepsin-like aspartic protease [Rufibacter psychrotolerans]|uniref:retropepsin-like aspartic protease n=1 Tax=Rufibacter psychrotolerans TaxID=2812556 RepID=UPI001966EA56|nr:retropepsin-like aspartic protease [Rufibacter sp. SYSU D00308]
MTHLARPFLLLLLVLVCQLRTYAQSKIPLEVYAGNLKAVRVTIEGKPYRFLFDTGGGETIISPQIAQALGKTPYGQLSAYRMSGEKVVFQKSDSVTLSLSGQLLFQNQVAVWDLMSILPKGLPQLDGVISLKTFSGKILGIDLKNNQLTVEDEKSFAARRKNLTLLNSRFANGLAGNELSLFLEVQGSNKKLWFLFDSGNLGHILLSPSTVQVLGLKASSAPGTELQNVPLTLHRKALPAPATVKDILYDGALNFSFIKENTYYLDLKKLQVWRD